MLLFNKDCLLAMQELEADSVDCIITDPPYGVGYKNDFYDDSEQAVKESMPKWFAEWYRLLKVDCYLYVFVGIKTIDAWITVGKQCGFTFKNIIATRSFNNGAITPENNFGFQFQPILVFSKGSGKKFNQVDFIPTSDEWLHDARNTNPKPFTYQYPNWIETEWAFATAKNSIKNLHPNEKNTTLIQFLIEISTESNGVVLDSFMGSGSTGIACLHSNREFIGCEIDDYYFKLAKRRLAHSKRNTEESLV